MINLVNVTEDDFELFIDDVSRLYAEQSIKSGRISEEGSFEWAKEATRKFLPQGLNTPDQFFLNVRNDTGERIGVIWAGKHPETPQAAFLFTILIFEPYQGRGYGKEAMKALEKYISERGYTSLGLHVYAFNTVAIGLYHSMGYQDTDFIMMKKLSEHQ